MPNFSESLISLSVVVLAVAVKTKLKCIAHRKQSISVKKFLWLLYGSTSFSNRISRWLISSFSKQNT